MTGQGQYTDVDIAIVGASFAGLALARAVQRASNGALRVVLLDRRPETGSAQPLSDDARAFALSAATRYFLEHLDVWSHVQDDAQTVQRIEITDSSLEAGVRPSLLAWDNVLQNGDPASYIVPANRVLTALSDAVASDRAIAQVRGVEIIDSEVTDAGHLLTFSDDQRVQARLVVAADGRNSPLRDKRNLKVVGWSHNQRGIVTTIRHHKPHQATAIQHFLPGGPFAMLPLKDNQTCITWSEDTNEAERILTLDEAGFAAELDRRLAGRLGAFEVVGPRQSWPLSTQLARGYVTNRFALVGDAAHGVHPIAGQGLNLGLRDVAALSEVIVDAAGLGLDFGRLDVLQRYEQWRLSDATINAFAYDGLNRLFSNDTAVFRAVREVGLGTFDWLHGLKAFFIRDAAGQSGEIPALMRKRAS